MQWLHLRRRKYSFFNPDSSTPIPTLVRNRNHNLIPDPNGQWSDDSETFNTVDKKTQRKVSSCRFVKLQVA